MSYGIAPWGSSPWGTGAALPPPTLVAVSSEPGPSAPSSAPAAVAERGGTILHVFGSNFFSRAEIPYVDVDVLIGSSGAYTVVASCFVFDPVFDIARNRILCGAPALANGLYHLRVTTDGGVSAVLEDAIAARRFADEYKTVSVRGKFSPAWETGPRLLRG